MPNFIPSMAFNLEDASIPGYPAGQRRLSELDGCFADRDAFQNCLRQGDPFIYQVTNVAAASGEGQLHYALGMIRPGKGRRRILSDGVFTRSTPGMIIPFMPHNWASAEFIRMVRHMLVFEQKTHWNCWPGCPPNGAPRERSSIWKAHPPVSAR